MAVEYRDIVEIAPLKTVRITSDGQGAYTEVRNGETGELISGIQKIRWELDMTKSNQTATVHLEILARGETVLNGEVVSNLRRAICPDCNKLHVLLGGE